MNMKIVLGESQLTIEDVVNVAQLQSEVCLSENPTFRRKLKASQDFLDQLFGEQKEIYGVTTGFGDSCGATINAEQALELPINLIRYHSCGLGEIFSSTEARAIQITRLASLVRGVSGVSVELLDFLVSQLNMGIAPRIPQEGSVGASGDLTPLAYLASTVIGEGDVFYKGALRPTQSVYQELGIKPLALKPKEGLALMNGTAVMTALACLAYKRAEYLCQLASRITAMNCLALLGNPKHFDKMLFEVKPHVGQGQIAEWIRQDLSEEFNNLAPKRLQDRYSIRCAPHVIGVLQDSFEFSRKFIEVELNSANDNPLIDGEAGRLLNGGNFYGGHIAFVMDSMKVLVANVADLLDRQLALLVDTKFSSGLSPNLSGAKGANAVVHHGFKGVQIGVSAWTAEALKLSLPASVFSRSTECHNQDKVSMGTIAARDCLRSLQLTEQVAAACIFASVQALELRVQKNELNAELLGKNIQKFKQDVFKMVNFVEKDRSLESDLRNLINLIQTRSWNLYS